MAPDYRVVLGRQQLVTDGPGSQYLKLFYPIGPDLASNFYCDLRREEV
jgi:hypothetical protein